MKHSLIFLIAAFFFSLSYVMSARAMESQQYQIQSEEVTSESSNTDDIHVSGVALNAVDQAEFNKNGYLLVSENESGVSFAIDNTIINFGALPTTKPSMISEKLHVSSKKGVTLTLIQSRPLTSISGSTLPATQCDNGCTNKHASLWKNTQSYGLGYSLNGYGLPEDFRSSEYFRALSDSTKNQMAESIFKTQNSNQNDFQIIFKLNPKSDTTENFNSLITIDALPNY